VIKARISRLADNEHGMVLHVQRTITLGPHCEDRQVEPGSGGPVVGSPVSDLDTIRLGSSDLVSHIGYKE
jgi:hypothetical protein